jgi:ABC-type uncharacterized transport system substrate-binding protein
MSIGSFLPFLEKLAKRKKLGLVLLLGALVCTFWPVMPVRAEEPGLATPKTNNGKKWRIGYLEGGVFCSYGPYLEKVIKGLMELAWVQKAEIPALDPSGDTRGLWRWLVQEAKSDYLEFVPDAHWSCNWDDVERKEAKIRILQRLNHKKDLDLMVAMGTWAGQDLVNNLHAVPTVVMCTSNAIQAGIIKSAEDSGFNHVHALVNPTRYEKQIRLFQEATGFKRLGIAYEDTKVGRTYAAIEDVERIAKDQNFEIVRCHSVSDVPDAKQAFHSLLKCHEALAPRIDAMYLTIQNGNELKNLPLLLAPFLRYGIPTFAMRSSEEVKYGVLMSLTTAATNYLGLFEATVIARIFNGASPRSLTQVFDDSTTKAAINLGVAKKICYNPPDWVVEMADEIYTEIQVPKMD